MGANAFTFGRGSVTSFEAILKPFIPAQSNNPNQATGFYLPVKLKGDEHFSVESAVVGNKAGGPGFSEASAVYQPYRFVTRSFAERHTYLLVAGFHGMSYSAEGVSRPHFTETTLWVGAYGAGMLSRSSAPQEPHKNQLFVLKQGASVLFFDAQKEVTVITADACGKEPLFRRATVEEVARYVLSEARLGGQKPKTQDWCFGALNELGDAAGLREFRTMYPDYTGT